MPRYLYYDHQTEFDAEIDRRRQEAIDLAIGASDPALQRKLQELKNRR
jgi:hypothetical protein